MREREGREEIWGHDSVCWKWNFINQKGKLNIYSDFSIHTLIHTRLVFDMTHLSFTEGSQ